MDTVQRLRNTLISGNKTFVQGNRLVERLCREASLQRDVVIAGLKQLRDSGEISCEDWFRGEPVGRVRLTIKITHTQAEQRWEALMVGQGVSEVDREALLGLSEKLSMWDEADIKRLLHGLVTLRNDMSVLQGQSRYLVSAKYLLGSSKLLETLPAHSLREYGIDINLLTGPPSYIITAGPPSPECVVLVENPQAMEAALQVKNLKEVAWVATFGYGLSRVGNEHGVQLASLIEKKVGLAGLVRQGTPPTLDLLLQHPKLYFWGDLDREGLRIYWQLKKRLPQLQLSGLYQPMKILIEKSDMHHPYTKLVAKPNQSAWHCPDNTVQQLLDLCEHRAIDQEAISSDDIQRYAHTVYT